jgi:hypothetical protein
MSSRSMLVSNGGSIAWEDACWIVGSDEETDWGNSSIKSVGVLGSDDGKDWRNCPIKGVGVGCWRQFHYPSSFVLDFLF